MGRRSGRVFALGDAVKVEVQSVSVVRRKVDSARAAATDVGDADVLRFLDEVTKEVGRKWS